MNEAVSNTAPPAAGRRAFGRLRATPTTAALALGVMGLAVAIGSIVWVSNVAKREGHTGGHTAALAQQIGQTQAELKSTQAQLKSTQTQLKSTQTDLQGTQVELKATSAKLATVGPAIDAVKTQLKETKQVDVSALTKRLTRVEGRIKHIAYCLPELPQDINGLSFHGYDDNGWLTGGYISSGYNISRFCSGLFYPSTGSGSND